MICALDLTEFEHMDCFIHKIQLVYIINKILIKYNEIFQAINDALDHERKRIPEIFEQVKISKNVVSFYNRSDNFRKLLADQQKLIDAPHHSLIQVKLFLITENI